MQPNLIYIFECEKHTLGTLYFLFIYSETDYVKNQNLLPPTSLSS